MKKSLIALAVLAASGAAMAQSSVTLYGVVDTSVAYVKGAENVSGMINSGNATSRLGFKGTEDLGNGLKAEFVLEGEVLPDNGGDSLNFKRQSTVGLSSAEFGQVRLGRALTASYNAVSRYDMFGTVGLGATRAWSEGYANRSDNMISYISPKFAGFGVGIDYGFGEKAKNKDSRYVGVGATYDNGPLSVGFGFDQKNNANMATADELKLDPKAVVPEDLKTMQLGASYDFAVVKLAGFYKETKYKDSVTGQKDGKLKTYNIGLSAPVGAAGVVKFAYNNYKETESKGKANQFSLGYVQNLSKRTAVYGTYAFLKNKNGADIALNGAFAAAGLKDGKKQQGIQVGVRHAF